jgi:hypothetical protein
MTIQSIQRLTWNPGLDNGERRLLDVYREMPLAGSSAGPWYVKALEDPRSPTALLGATDPFAHGCIHIVLGRGMLPQDEAFVHGFTMGAARAPDWQRRLFRGCARRLHASEHRFSLQDAEVFDFAFEAARTCATFALHGVDFRRISATPLAQVRRYLGIEVGLLRALHEAENERWPLGRASTRLGVAARASNTRPGQLIQLSEVRARRRAARAPARAGQVPAAELSAPVSMRYAK